MFDEANDLDQRHGGIVGAHDRFPNRGQLVAQAELKQEQLVVADVDLDKATHAMFKFDMGGCAEMLFGDVVAPEEYATAGPMRVPVGAKGK